MTQAVEWNSDFREPLAANSFAGFYDTLPLLVNLRELRLTSCHFELVTLSAFTQAARRLDELTYIKLWLSDVTIQEIEEVIELCPGLKSLYLLVRNDITGLRATSYLSDQRAARRNKLKELSINQSFIAVIRPRDLFGALGRHSGYLDPSKPISKPARHSTG